MGQNGHGYVDNMARDILQAAILRAMADLYAAEFEVGPHPLKPASQRFAVRIGGIRVEQEETRFKVSNHPEGEVAITAAFLAVCFRRAETIATQIDITRKLSRWLSHTLACAARDADSGATGAPCSCGLAAVLAKIESQAQAAAAGTAPAPAEGSIDG